MTSGAIRIVTIDVNDVDVLTQWATKLRSLCWGKDELDPLEQLKRAEFRLCAYVPECSIPIAFASITPEGSPDDYDDGELWFDHLFVEEGFRRRGVVKPLYEKQLEYVRAHPGRRVLRAPWDPTVVEFSKKRGWRKEREVLITPFGVYGLPRERI